MGALLCVRDPQADLKRIEAEAKEKQKRDQLMIWQAAKAEAFRLTQEAQIREQKARAEAYMIEQQAQITKQRAIAEAQMIQYYAKIREQRAIAEAAERAEAERLAWETQRFVGVANGRIKMRNFDETYEFDDLFSQQKSVILNDKKRKNLHDDASCLIDNILSHKLIIMCTQEDNILFPIVPEKFEVYKSYFKVFSNLQHYEVYNRLLRKENKNSAGICNLESDQKQKSAFWICYMFEMYDKEYKKDVTVLSTQNSQQHESTLENFQEDQKVNKNFNLDDVKQYDLLLISGCVLQLKKKNKPLNQQIDFKELRELLESKTAFLAIVTETSQRMSKKKLKDCIKIESQFEFDRGFVYPICSLKQDIKEFAVLQEIKSSSFFQTLMRPSQIQCQVDERVKMIFKNHLSTEYNDSQADVLYQVDTMQKNSILLIQGPPGTGKTKTITGVISQVLKQNQNSRILLCAPSNTAVDEIVTRIGQQGLPGYLQKSDNNLLQLILRVGALSYEPSEHVERFELKSRCQKLANLDRIELIKKQIKNLNQQITYTEDQIQEAQPHIDQLYQDIKVIEMRIDELNEKFRSAKNKVQNKQKIEKLEKEYDRDDKVFREEIVKINDSVSPSLKQIIQDKERYQQIKKMQTELLNLQNGKIKAQCNLKTYEPKILEKAQIIFTTLATAANGKLSCIKDSVDYLIIDEACQCSELTVLLPFSLNPHRVIMFGDHKQLPATIFSPNGDKTKFQRSLFERLHDGGQPTFTLNIQYRMHSIIRQFPAKQFYHDQIKDADWVKQRETKPEFQVFDELQRHFSRLVFFDLDYSKETPDDSLSKFNKDEAKFTFDLIHCLLPLCNIKSLSVLENKIGVITPYKGQLRFLSRELQKQTYQLKCDIKDIVVNTVDAFQGQEREIIIFNCVRSNKKKQLGFLKDFRRLNVAITRPKHFLFVVGNKKTLMNDPLWADMITNCEQVPAGYFQFIEPIRSYKDIQNELTRAYNLRSQLI